jgi:GR25 family glycosyltransferase involved in LPS biosynthesis
MKVGAVLIHSSSSYRRLPYVEAFKKFFENTEVELNVIDGVFKDGFMIDARDGMAHNKISKGELGCALAHFNALKLSLEKEYDYVYIFEDDVEIIAKNYESLKKWISNLNVEFDLLLLTNVGFHTGLSEDGRLHYKTFIDELIKCSCPFGTQAYFLGKETLKSMFNFQKKAIDCGKIYIADGLIIHCEKSSNRFLNIYTPKNNHLFFKHEGFENSLIGH